MSAVAVDRVVEHWHWPWRCRCGHLFQADECEPIGEPARHQVAELPEIAVEVTEHRARCGALTERAALFRIAPDRHEREARAVLGEEFQGIVCSDRWWAYNYLDPARRQVCWSHIIRDFTAQSEGLEPEKSFGEAGLEIAGRFLGLG